MPARQDSFREPTPSSNTASTENKKNTTTDQRPKMPARQDSFREPTSSVDTTSTENKENNNPRPIKRVTKKSSNGNDTSAFLNPLNKNKRTVLGSSKSRGNIKKQKIPKTKRKSM